MRSDLTVHDVLEAREVIETELAGLAATRATQTNLERLERELASFGEAVAKQDWDAAGNSHLQFHLALLDAVNLRALAIMLKPMQEVILFSSIPPRADDVSLWEYDVHPPILEALKARTRLRCERRWLTISPPTTGPLIRKYRACISATGRSPNACSLTCSPPNDHGARETGTRRAS
jgi:DNA-binding GntR family transcriptional regulator